MRRFLFNENDYLGSPPFRELIGCDLNSAARLDRDRLFYRSYHVSHLAMHYTRRLVERRGAHAPGWAPAFSGPESGPGSLVYAARLPQGPRASPRCGHPVAATAGGR